MIYLDHAAATPVSPRAIAAMTEFFTDKFYNPSAPYLPAKHVREAYEEAKSTIAKTIGAKSADLVMTSGATESINLAFTVLDAGGESGGKKYRALILATEHPAVFAVAGRYDYSTVAVDRGGMIDLADLKLQLSGGAAADEIALISISLASSELGVVQPLAEVTQIVRAIRRQRQSRGVSTPLFLFTDASQAAQLIDLNMARLGADLAALSAAKCGAPKGTGALYVAHGVPIHPLILGGGQELGLRSGTENVPAAIAFATAFSDAQDHLSASRKLYQSMADTFRQALLEELTNAKLPKNFQNTPAQSFAEPEPVIFLGNPKHQLANFIPLSFPGIDAERLIYQLEQQGIYVSTGAACAASKGQKSRALTAIGLSDAEIAGSLRITLGSTNSPEQMRPAAKAIVAAVAKERARLAKKSSGASHV